MSEFAWSAGVRSNQVALKLARVSPSQEAAI
jgi:hypothetical protein